MQVPLLNMAGTEVGEIELSDAIFAAPINRGLMHQALVRQLANARLGTHKTKSRSEVRGGGRKPWRQKGTGRARHGSTRSPIWVGGGTAFGPQPRSYEKKMPRKMRQAALRSALSVKAGSEQIIVVDDLSMEVPKTKEMIKTLSALGLDGQTILLLLPERHLAVERSAHNLPQVKTLHTGYLNIQDLLGYDKLVLTKSSVDKIHQWLGKPEVEAEVEVEAGEEL
jgi:large subunit ribosomal protein L4